MARGMITLGIAGGPTEKRITPFPQESLRFLQTGGPNIWGNSPAHGVANQVATFNTIPAIRGIADMWVFPLLKSLLPVVVAFLLPTTDTLDHRRVGNGTHRHGLFQEPMEELPAMA